MAHADYFGTTNGKPNSNASAFYVYFSSFTSSPGSFHVIANCPSGQRFPGIVGCPSLSELGVGPALAPRS